MATLARPFKQASPLCFGKDHLTLSEEFFLASLSFYEAVRENRLLYGCFFLLLYAALLHLRCLRLRAQVSQTDSFKGVKSADWF